MLSKDVLELVATMARLCTLFSIINLVFIGRPHAPTSLARVSVMRPILSNSAMCSGVSIGLGACAYLNPSFPELVNLGKFIIDRRSSSQDLRPVGIRMLEKKGKCGAVLG